MRTRSELRGYQRRASRFMCKRRYGALLIDMGLGKTIIALTAIVDLLSTEQIDSVLLVAPIRVIQAVWRQEAKEWQHTRKLVFSLVHGSPAERMAALRKPAHIHMINPEGLKWLASVLGRKPWPWSMLIVDESTEFAEQKTIRFRSLRRGLRHFKRRYVMTGTPTPRSLLQIWSQMFIADLGASLGQRYTDFKENHFYRTGYMGYKLEPKDGSEDIIAEAMSQRVVRLVAEDWIEVPKLVTVPIWVDLPPHARELYERLEAEMFLQFEDYALDGDEEALAETAAALSMKCLAGETEVLTPNGWKRIDQFEVGDSLWDGIEWVNASGLVCNGYREVVSCWGIDATPDHLMLTRVGWRKVEEINGEPTNRLDRAAVRVPDCAQTAWVHYPGRGAKEPEGNLGLPVRMWGNRSRGRSEFAQSEKGREKVLRVPPPRDVTGCVGYPRDVWASGVGVLECAERKVLKPAKQKLGGVRRAGHPGLQALAGIFRQFLGRHGVFLRTGADPRPYRNQQGVFQIKLPLGYLGHTSEQPPEQCLAGYPERKIHCRAGGADVRDKLHNSETAVAPGLDDSRSTRTCKVYDIVNAGPRNRFVARGTEGPVIVHNCRQIANGFLFTSNVETGARSWRPVHDAKIDALKEIVRETYGAPILVPYQFKPDVVRLTAAFPKFKAFDKHHVEDLVHDWNLGKIPGLILHPANSKYGLNLQKGGHMLAWFGGTFSRLFYDQTIGRLRRSGQVNKVYNYIILARNTVDEVVLEALEGHGARQQRISNAFKDHYERRIGQLRGGGL